MYRGRPSIQRPVPASVRRGGLGLCFLLAAYSPAADCNGNGVEDELDIRSGQSQDCDSNGVPDECDLLPPPFALGKPWSFPAGGRAPVDAAAADLDGDGRLDLAISARDSGVVVLHFNDAAGAFGSPRVVYAGSKPGSVAAADFDGDGAVDIAVALESEVRLFFNNATWRFPPARTLSTGFAPLALAAADLDGDGAPDLCVSNSVQRPNPLDDNLSVLLNEGGAVFGRPRHYAAGRQPAFLAAGDFDRSGLPDIAVLSRNERGSAQVMVIAAHGGSFAPVADFQLGETPLGLAAGDLDGDGIVDLLVAHGSRAASPGTADLLPARVSALLGVESGLSPPRSACILPSIQALATADLDGDGLSDLAVADGGNRLSVLLHDGNLDFGGMASTATSSPLARLVAADLDGDGRPDLAGISTNSGRCTLVLNEARRPPAGELPFAGVVFDLPASGGALGDFDGDGGLDLAAPRQNGSIAIFGNPGDGYFRPRAELEGDVPRESVVAVDLDHDGDLDLVAFAPAREGVSIYLNEAGDFSPAPTIEGVRPRHLGAADLDADGDADLFFAHDPNPSEIVVLRGRPAVTFLPPETHQLEHPAASLAAGDLDGDGDLDLFAAGSDLVMVLLNTGRGRFEAGPNLGQPPWGAVFAAAADLDDDGLADLIVLSGGRVPGQGDLHIFWNAIREQSPEVTHLPIGPEPQWAVAADLEGDGSLGIALSQRSPRGISIFTRGGARSFAPAGTFALSRAPAGALHAADLDRNGFCDLAIAVPGPELGFAVLFNRPRRSPHDRNRNGLLDRCEEVPFFRRGDVDGDGGLTLTDPLRLLSSLFLGGGELPCLEAADARNDGAVDLSDAIYLLDHLFRGGPLPAPPGGVCGPDPDPPGSAGDLGCRSYGGCP
jgi:hypothetical protein